MYMSNGSQLTEQEKELFYLRISTFDVLNLVDRILIYHLLVSLRNYNLLTVFYEKDAKRFYQLLNAQISRPRRDQ
uniref:Uncharacterized protein n=1 Tax=Megastigmus ssRNA virus TaxID=2602441 RepID=A0A5B8PCI5_9VIRU|nr:hypothetical protein [Megastigmus ssRNA virus]